MESLENAKDKAAQIFAEGGTEIPQEVIPQGNAGTAVQENAPTQGDGGTPAAQPNEPTPQPGDVTPEGQTEKALQAAETAVQVAQEKDTALHEVNEKLEGVMEQNENLRKTIEQMSAQNAEASVNQMMQAPVFDADAYAYADAGAQAQMMADYQNAMAEYNRAQVRSEIEKEFEPMMQYAREGMQAREKAEAIKAIKATVPELADIEAKAPVLDNIIANNPFLGASDKSMEEKYIMAYMLSRGIDAVNNPPAPPEPPKAPTAQELMEYAKNNPEFMELLEKQRIASVQNAQQVPPLTASSGAVNVAPTIENKPKNLEESRELFKKMFHMK